MNMPYKTSRDYQLLKKLLDEGKEIVCFTDFPIDNRIFRDVCKARKIGEGRYSVTYGYKCAKHGSSSHYWRNRNLFFIDWAELPRVSYQTSKGNVVLFPDEIMPVDINLLQQEINEGYIMLSDGRYLPPKEAVQQCYNAFGIRVGLGDNWEDIYDGWNKEMK